MSIMRRQKWYKQHTCSKSVERRFGIWVRTVFWTCRDILDPLHQCQSVRTESSWYQSFCNSCDSTTLLLC